MRKEVAQEGFCARLEQELLCAGSLFLLRWRAREFELFDGSHGKKLQADRNLSQRVNESRSYDLDLVHVVFQKEVASTCRDRPGFPEAGRVTVGKLGHQLSAGAGDILRRPAPGGDEQCGLRFEPRRQAEQIAVERTAQALVPGDEDDRALADFAHFQQWMAEIDRLRRG